MFFVSKLCFLSFSMHSHAESSRNSYQKISFGSRIFYVTIVFSKIVGLNLQTIFFMENRVIQVSGRNTFESAFKITSKSKFSNHNVQIPYHLHPALSNSLKTGLPRPDTIAKHHKKTIGNLLCYLCLPSSGKNRCATTMLFV